MILAGDGVGVVAHKMQVEGLEVWPFLEKTGLRGAHSCWRSHSEAALLSFSSGSVHCGFGVSCLQVWKIWGPNFGWRMMPWVASRNSFGETLAEFQCCWQPRIPL